MEPLSFEKVMEVSQSSLTLQLDTHIGAAMSGIVADARVLVDHARVECQNHRFAFNEAMTVETVTQSIADLCINFGEGAEGEKRKPMGRPYGVALLVAGVDETGPHLY